MKIVLYIQYGWVLIKLISKVPNKHISGAAKSQNLKVCTSFTYTSIYIGIGMVITNKEWHNIIFEEYKNYPLKIFVKLEIPDKGIIAVELKYNKFDNK